MLKLLAYILCSKRAVSFHAALNYSTNVFQCVGNLPAGSRSLQ